MKEKIIKATRIAYVLIKGANGNETQYRQYFPTYKAFLKEMKDIPLHKLFSEIYVEFKFYKICLHQEIYREARQLYKKASLEYFNEKWPSIFRMELWESGSVIGHRVPFYFKDLKEPPQWQDIFSRPQCNWNLKKLWPYPNPEPHEFITLEQLYKVW